MSPSVGERFRDTGDGSVDEVAAINYGREPVCELFLASTGEGETAERTHPSNRMTTKTAETLAERFERVSSD